MNVSEVHFHNQLVEGNFPTMEQEVLAGLTSKPKYTSPKFLYDQKGSELFEKLCELPEYYPTRTEEAILAYAMPEIAALAGEDATLVEFGSGASRKVRLLLSPFRYNVTWVSTYPGSSSSRAPDGSRQTTPGWKSMPPALTLPGAYPCQRVSIPGNWWVSFPDRASAILRRTPQKASLTACIDYCQQVADC